MRLYDITRDLLSVPAPAGVPEVSVSKLMDMGRGDLCSESVLSACLHMGTHCDAYCHFVPGEMGIGQLALEHFVGPCSVVSVPRLTRLMSAHFEQYLGQGCPERLLLRGGGGSYVAPEAARLLVDAGVKTIGTDAWSISAPGDETGTHRTFLQNHVAILEDLDLEAVPDGSYFLSAAPIKLGGLDGAHCRALLCAFEGW